MSSHMASLPPIGEFEMNPSGMQYFCLLKTKLVLLAVRVYVKNRMNVNISDLVRILCDMSTPDHASRISNENSIDGTEVSEEIETFESHLNENGETASADCQEVLIGECFESPSAENVSLPATSEKSSICPICLKGFNESKKLLRHKECHERRRFKCDLCDSFLKTRSSYNSHMQRHTNGKRFECDTCRKIFAAARDLKNHQKIHDQQAERFRCELCGKDFGRIYSLLDHKKLHSGEEVFSCPKCDMVFPKRRNLLLHERSHLVEEDRLNIAQK
ncbi:gastrula zinc finger protein XlCGF7.1-like [Toxorhynchites rutilus septentrionalis]|uniref:gastrula zinc finger protein XlCGF7.1-like n=1 Tax=Toxorhynchites rutilus septentrionalis TaxID=329112 RepID=UPI00247A8709|nr:gastrula zinc finger protein XlCGF7.1-like [Toxorhynchites rutilus septentrionalis]